MFMQIHGCCRGKGAAGLLLCLWVGLASAADPHSSYERLFSGETNSQRGVFIAHEAGGKLYFEIPTNELGKDFLLVTTLARTAPDGGGAGTPVNNRLVRWERRGNQVLLRSPLFETVATEDARERLAVRGATQEAILAAFPIEATGAGDAPVIEVSRLFVTEIPELSARRVLSATGFDAGRSFLDSVKVFPGNLEVEAVQTYTSPGWGAAPAPRAGLPPLISGRLSQPSGSCLVHFSMLRLPETKMLPRLWDDRLGFFTVRQTRYDGAGALRRDLIQRWRLEKQTPSESNAEPVKPLVYYLDPAIPAKVVPYVKRGVEAWQPAFEQAGFRRAIVAREAPPPAEDPNWSPDDARYSIIRWVPSPLATAMGMTIADPRTGEILKADIHFSESVLRDLCERYFYQVGPLDPRARKLPLPDDLMGELIVNIVSHEVGHTLGLAHNMKASSTYPLDSLRDAAWLRKMGGCPSVMDYNPFNYVAQPEDKIPPELLLPRIGPYDEFAIAWAYRPIPGAVVPEDETPTLGQWLGAQEDTPWLRYRVSRALGADPGESQDGIGDSDPVRAAALGTRNLQRVLDNLVQGVLRPGENYDSLERVYTETLQQWRRELKGVALLVGALEAQGRHAGSRDAVFAPVSRRRQREAVQYLNASLFRTPQWAIRPEIERRIEPEGSLERILSVQKDLLDILLDPLRLARLQETQAAEGDQSYAPTEYFSDLRAGIFAELLAPHPRIDPYRRNLQRAYVGRLGERLNENPAAPETRDDGKDLHVNWDDDIRALARGELREIGSEIDARLKKVTDPMTRLHLIELRDHLGHLLEPRYTPQFAPLKASTPMG